MTYIKGKIELDYDTLENSYYLDDEIEEIWFIRENHTYNSYDDDDCDYNVEIKSNVVERGNPLFDVVMKHYDQEVTKIQHQKNLEKKDAEYKTYLELKAKFEKE
jgi:hypothetical protein